MDHELLQIQRRKSAPKVVIEEFVQVDSDEDADSKEDKSKEDEEHKVSDDVWNANEQLQVSKKPHIVKKHIEIEDVSTDRGSLPLGESLCVCIFTQYQSGTRFYLH